MTKPRIYCPRNMVEGGTYDLGRDHLHYLKSVLRRKTGDRLILFDGKGNEYDSIVKNLTDESITVEVVKKQTLNDAASDDVVLVQALPKTGKMELIIQKTTELGVGRIIPFLSERSVPRLSPDKSVQKAVRWRKIALEATRQCGRTSVPEIGEILTLDEALRCTEAAEAKIIFWEEETRTSVREILTDRKFMEAKDIAIIIGPEGGLARQEVDKACAAGYISASIGARILKVDTAAIAALSIIQYERGFFKPGRGEQHDGI